MYGGVFAKNKALLYFIASNRKTDENNVLKSNKKRRFSNTAGKF